ncbi:hypothetical protein DL93DRAFT_2078231 [Clavulina sp. PMI_390]|nr:hypothetical protein DL93DRAFT_2078231 [Clavulina sp. PMI_390]
MPSVPNGSVVTSGLAGQGYNSLGALAQGGNPQVVTWLNGWGPNVGINIVIADWISLYPTLIPAIIALNGGTVPPVSLSASRVDMERTAVQTNHAPVSRDDLLEGLKDGTIKLAEVIERTHAHAFRVLGRNPSNESAQALMVLQDLVEESELGKAKFVRKPEVAKDDSKLQKKAKN